MQTRQGWICNASASGSSTSLIQSGNRFTGRARIKGAKRQRKKRGRIEVTPFSFEPLILCVGWFQNIPSPQWKTASVVAGLFLSFSAGFHRAFDVSSEMTLLLFFAQRFNYVNSEFGLCFSEVGVSLQHAFDAGQIDVIFVSGCSGMFDDESRLCKGQLRDQLVAEFHAVLVNVTRQAGAQVDFDVGDGREPVPEALAQLFGFGRERLGFPQGACLRSSGVDGPRPLLFCCAGIWGVVANSRMRKTSAVNQGCFILPEDGQGQLSKYFPD